MKALLGVASLLLVVAIIGFVAGHQLKGLRHAATSSSGSAAASAATGVQPRQVQQQVRDDLAKALEQAASNNARAEEATK